MLLTKVDLPEPDTPVTHVKTPKGILRFALFKLLPVAPFNSINCFDFRLFSGISIFQISVQGYRTGP